MLRIEDLQVKIGETEVLKHIDLEIQPGETHILFGPNGSGKTTLLMTIMGYHQYRITAGFSGGEIKRSELLQLMAQDADLLLFDEPESGVDLENISLIGHRISSLLQRDFKIEPDRSQIQKKRERTKMGLIITHTGFILDYVTADRGQVLFDGVMSCKSNPQEIFTCIKEMGYEECIRCKS
jgi:Fe-S cluster assembly ATPase SufC